MCASDKTDGIDHCPPIEVHVNCQSIRKGPHFRVNVSVYQSFWGIPMLNQHSWVESAKTTPIGKKIQTTHYLQEESHQLIESYGYHRMCHGFSMVFPSFSYVFHHVHVPMVFPSFSRGFPIIFPCVPSFFLDFPMVFPSFHAVSNTQRPQAPLHRCGGLLRRDEPLGHAAEVFAAPRRGGGRTAERISLGYLWVTWIDTRWYPP